MKHAITFEIDTSLLPNFTDDHLAALWHIAQANPAPIDDLNASRLAEFVGREIITRWLSQVPPQLWNHQGAHEAIRYIERSKP